jgi:membrane fusion protein (multidrug efflux system)
MVKIKPLMYETNVGIVIARMQEIKRNQILASALIATLLLIAGCAQKPEPAKPAPVVKYVVVKPQSVTITTNLPGRTTAFRIAEIRPQVSGVILKRMFVEGSTVKAGSQLYQIDPAPFQASLESAIAVQAKAEASVVSSMLLVQRYKPLADARAVSRQDYDNAVSSEAQNEADVATAKANVHTAQINLAYTRMISPISGRTGRSSVTEGALVTAAQTTALLTVQQLDPIYVDVTQPSTLLLRLRRELASGMLTNTGPDQAKVTLTEEDGHDYPQAGRLKFSEVTVDTGTGSVTLRAEFPNKDNMLLPGMFVHERIQEGISDKALLVPQKGVTHNQKGEPTAMVVSADSKVELRILKTDRAIGEQWLVTAGLVAGDKLIVEGLQDIKPGAKVDATEMLPADAKKEASAAAVKPPGDTTSTSDKY